MTTASKLALPNAGDWNRFWETNKVSSRPSWSKRRILDIIQPYAVRGLSAMDAGCGSGFFAKYFCDEGMHTTALDYSAQALAMTQEMTQSKATIVQADLTNPDITGEITTRFDLIFSDGLLEHFSGDDQNLIMLNLKKLLKENGVLISFVPNRYSPWELIRPYFMPGIKEDPFTMKQLIDLNKKNALLILRSGGVNTLPIAFSPDGILGPSWGMLLYTIAKKQEYGKS